MDIGYKKCFCLYCVFSLFKTSLHLLFISTIKVFVSCFEIPGTPFEDRDEKQNDYIKSLSEIISDLDYSIEWMKTGKRPGLRRGIERRAVYQREKSMDPLLMQKYFQSEKTEYKWDIEEKQDVITSWDRERINDALSVLTELEQEVYLMSRGQCFSFSDIAKLLKISKSSIQTIVKRADNKIGKRIKESLFCLCG